LPKTVSNVKGTGKMTDTSVDLPSNPLLTGEGLPPFDQIEPRHVVPAVRHVLAEAEKRLEELEQNVIPTWSGTIEATDAIERPFEFAWGPVTHLFGVKNSPELREAYDDVLGDMVAFGLRLKQSEPIFRALKAIKDGDDWTLLEGVQRRVIEQKLLDAELAGIGLEGADRERFNDIARELSQLSTDFSNHVLDATKEFSLVLVEKNDVAGLPGSLLSLAAGSFNEAAGDDEAAATPEAGPWRITLDAPSFVPFMQHCRHRHLRESVYRAHVTRASAGDLDNAALIPRILRLRKEQAKLLGYANFAEVSLAKKMAPDADAVWEMFETLRSASWESAVRDMDDIRRLAADSGETEPLTNWDIPFWTERLRETRFDFTDEELRPYFPLERVLEGLFRIVERLFGVTVKAADGEAGVWQEDVRFFHLFDDEGRPIASFYLDPYSRPQNKRGGAWMDECLVRRLSDGKLQLPVAHLVCNSTPPVGERPSLMTFREVETLFHEFGHGLQHMLTTVDYADASGINGVEWDAVELPSQFMENWCYHKTTLIGMTAHYQSGEPLPDELFEKICAARTYRAGTNMLRQLRFGMTDMQLHTRFDPDGNETVLDVHRRVTKETSVLPMFDGDRSLCSFQHIFAGGYAAGYYSYKWAELLSADAFSAFEEAGLGNEQAVAETGRRFRDTILAQGGGRHPMELFKQFRGREPNAEALLRHNGLT
jgi:oligopeptidase A